MYICDQIWQKPVPTHTIERHTFSLPLNSYINKLTILVCAMSNGSLGCFSVACFLSLSDAHECLGGLQMALVCLEKQSSGWKSLHNWFMRLAIDLATFCDNYGLNWDHLAVCSVVWIENSTTLWFPTTPYPYSFMITCVIVENYLKWWVIQLAVHCRVRKFE